MTAPRRLAVVDIGTNSVRLTAADVADGQVSIRFDLGEVTRLGAGLVAGGVIDPDDEARTAECLLDLVARARTAGFSDLNLVGTEVFRAAVNGSEVQSRLSRLVGVSIQVLSGAEEAEAAFVGATSGITLPEGQSLAVADIGGGSTELILGGGGHIEFSRSLPVGALRVTSAWSLEDSPSAATLAAARQAVDIDYRPFAPLAARVRAGAGLIGVGGSFCALAAHGGGVVPYDPERVQGLPVSRTVIRAAIADWAGHSLADRMARGGLSEGRARVVLGGALAAEALLTTLDIDVVRVSVRGLRHGLLERLAQS